MGRHTLKCCCCQKTAHVIYEKRYYCATCRYNIQLGKQHDVGALGQTRTGTPQAARIFVPL